MKSRASARFQEIEHTADAALQVYGKDCGELLINAALGMFGLIATWENAPLSTEREISLRDVDGETLLVDWLSELLYLHEMEGVVYIDFDILSASPNSLRAIARGTHEWLPQTAVKAVTFNDLRIDRTPHGYSATIVFDT